jgi:hypothetical protein
VTEWVTVNGSPIADRVALAFITVRNGIIPPVIEVNSAICATVTGMVSDPFTVNDPVKVTSDVPKVCARAAILRINPPLAVTISPAKVVSPPTAAVVVAVRPMKNAGALPGKITNGVVVDGVVAAVPSGVAAIDQRSTVSTEVVLAVTTP